MGPASSIPYDEVYSPPYSPALVESPEGFVLDEPREPIGLTAWGLFPVAVITSCLAQYYGASWIPQVASGSFVVLWLIVDILGKRRGFRFHVPYVLFFIYHLWSFVCSVTSRYPVEHIIGASLSSAKVFGFSLVVANVVRRRAQAIPLFLGLALAPSIILLAFRQELSQTNVQLERGVQSDALRFGGEELGNANQLAMGGNVGLLGGVLAFLIIRRPLLRWLPLAMVPGVLYYVSRLGSRTGLAMVVVLAAGFWFFHLRGIFRFRPGMKIVGVALLVVLLLGAGIWLANSPFAFRFTDVGAKYEEGRFQLVLAALGLFAKSPIMGHGIFGFQSLGLKLNVTHNMPTEVLVRGGIPAFLLYHGAWFIVIRMLWRLRRLALSPGDRAVVNMMLLLCVLFHGHSMTGSTLAPRIPWLAIGACVGLAYGLQEKVLEARKQAADWGDSETAQWDDRSTPLA